jgi:DNA-binding NtrC family response regulator
MSFNEPGTALSPLPQMVGESPVIVELRREIERAARSQAKVLILGETGVGKEVVARLIHAGSARRARPFVAVNCSGIPETLLASELFGHARGSFTGAYRDNVGLVRRADKGTLFLDELGEMSLAMQAALLRFTETGEVQPVGADGPTGRTDTRLITATNRDLRERIAEGQFREDLYYRLNVIQIWIPPLRDRGADVLMLFRHYLTRVSADHRLPCPQLDPDAEQLLLAYAWPGNVRELRNVAERVVLREQTPVTADSLPRELRGEIRPSVSVTSAPAAQPVGELPSEPGSQVFEHEELAHRTAGTVQRLWEVLMAGGDFWSVVQQPFKARELTRSELAALIDRGLQHTRGSYRGLIKTFNLPATDYKRFHAFLYQQNCNLPVGPYRHGTEVRSRRASVPTYQAAS